MTAPEPTRTIPDGWIEMTADFILEVQHGIHAGWMYINEPGIGDEAVVYTPQGGTPRAWSVKRDRVLGQPVVVVEGESPTSATAATVKPEPHRF